MVAGDFLQTPFLLGGLVDLLVGAPDAPVGIRDVRGVGNFAEVFADGLLVEFEGVVPELLGKGGRHPIRRGGVVVGERETGEGLKVRILR